MASWVSELEAGNQVFVWTGYMGTNVVVETVAKVTPKQIVLSSGSRWNRETGRKIGGSHSWSHDSLEAITNEDAIRRYNQQRIETKLSKLRFKELTTEQCLQLIGVLAGFETNSKDA